MLFGNGTGRTLSTPTLCEQSPQTTANDAPKDDTHDYDEDHTLIVTCVALRQAAGIETLERTKNVFSKGPCIKSKLGDSSAVSDEQVHSLHQI